MKHIIFTVFSISSRHAGETPRTLDSRSVSWSINAAQVTKRESADVGVILKELYLLCFRSLGHENQYIYCAFLSVGHENRYIYCAFGT